jgi:hypothetical protein
MAWAIGPGTSQSSSRALKARDDPREPECRLGSGVAISRFQRLGDSDACSPRALPRAITFRAFGAEDSSLNTDSEALFY